MTFDQLMLLTFNQLQLLISRELLILNDAPTFDISKYAYNLEHVPSGNKDLSEDSYSIHVIGTDATWLQVTSDKAAAFAVTTPLSEHDYEVFEKFVRRAIPLLQKIKPYRDGEVDLMIGLDMTTEGEDRQRLKLAVAYLVYKFIRGET